MLVVDKKSRWGPERGRVHKWEFIVRLVIGALVLAVCVLATIWAGMGTENLGFTSQNLRDGILILVAYLMLVIRRWKKTWVFIINLLLVAVTFFVWRQGLGQSGEIPAQWLLLATVVATVATPFLPDETLFLWQARKAPESSADKDSG